MGDLVLICVLVVAYLFVFASCISAFVAERRHDLGEPVLLKSLDNPEPPRSGADATPSKRFEKRRLTLRPRRILVRTREPEPALSR